MSTSTYDSVQAHTFLVRVERALSLPLANVPLATGSCSVIRGEADVQPRPALRRSNAVRSHSRKVADRFALPSDVPVLAIVAPVPVLTIVAPVPVRPFPRIEDMFSQFLAEAQDSVVTAVVDEDVPIVSDIPAARTLQRKPRVKCLRSLARSQEKAL